MHVSHTLTLSAADKQKSGQATIRSKQALFAACQELGHPEPEWVQELNIGDNDSVPILTTGWAVKLQGRNGREGWLKPCVFNPETGDEWFNNWPVFDHQHAEVQAGRRRLGEGGRWGDIELLDELRSTYVNHCNTLLEEAIVEQSRLEGSTIQILDRQQDRVELLVTT